MTRLTATLIIICAALLPLLPAQATVIQILHTNDLHAALNTAGEPASGVTEFGGWGQVKTILDQYTEAAKANGIETLRLDAGDFLEGSLLYFPKNGANVLKTYLQMGFDASTLGNHDWLMGATGLDRLLGAVPFTHPLLAANIKISPRLKNLSQQLQPYTVIEKNGVKFGIMGLTTTESFYKWITKIRSKKNDMKIQDFLDRPSFQSEENYPEPIPGIATETIQKLKSQSDVVIGLTHVGYSEDWNLVEKTKGLDLVVGGHSHTFLETLNVVKDPDGREVPIVQTGYNGRNIGRIMIEVLPGQAPRVLTYELIEVPHSTTPDPVVLASTKQANEDYEKLYTKEHLNEVIGQSEVRLVPGKFGPTAYSKFAVDAIRESIGSQVGIDVGFFHANTPLPGGEVTRRKLMEMYPRKFESDQNQGLSVYRAKILGLVLALGLKFSVKYGVYSSFSGVDYTATKLDDKAYARQMKKLKLQEDRDLLTPFRATKIKVNGQKICLNCTYEVALPESIVRGAYGISPLIRLIIWGGKRTNVTVWEALEKHLRNVKVIRRLDLTDQSSAYRFSNRYQKKYGKIPDLEQMDVQGTNFEQYLRESHVQEASGADSHENEHHEHHDKLDDLNDAPQVLLNKFIKEVTNAKKLLPALKKDADADALFE